MQTYFRGDTIIFDVSGSDSLNLDSVDFVVFLYRNQDVPEIKIEKSGAEKLTDNSYRVMIEANVTKTLPVGKYALEIYLKGTTKHVYYQADFLQLKDSASKTETIL